MRGKRERDKELAEIAESHAQQEALSEKELKKLERKDGAEKRRKARQKDKVARFAGIILLGMVLFTGFLLWILGEMQAGNETIHQNTITPIESQRNSIRVR